MTTRTSREDRHKAEAERRAAAKARKPATVRRERPPVGRDAVAEAIHEAVCLTGRDEGIGHCDGYAFGAAIALSVLTGQEWLPQGGEARFGTGQQVDSPDGELCFAWQPSATTPALMRMPGAPAAPGITGGGLADGELHAWAARAVDGRVAEVCDLAARHVPALSELAGLGWAREPVPYLWGTLEDLSSQRFWYIADKATTDVINAEYRRNMHSYEDIAVLALWRLGWHDDRRAGRLIHDRTLLELMRGGYRFTESVPGASVVVRDRLGSAPRGGYEWPVVTVHHPEHGISVLNVHGVRARQSGALTLVALGDVPDKTQMCDLVFNVASNTGSDVVAMEEADVSARLALRLTALIHNDPSANVLFVPGAEWGLTGADRKVCARR